MFSLEPFSAGAHKKKITQADIDELKKNMQKVPEIQKKGDEHQKYESKKADESLQNKVKQLQSDVKKTEYIQEEDDKTRRQRILQWISAKLS